MATPPRVQPEPEEPKPVGNPDPVPIPQDQFITFEAKEWVPWWTRVEIGGTAHPISLPVPFASTPGGEYFTWYRGQFMRWYEQTSVQEAINRHIHYSPQAVDCLVTMYRDPLEVQIMELSKEQSEPEPEPAKKSKTKDGFLLRLQPEVRQVIQEAADDEGLSVNVWAERVLFDGAMKVKHLHAYSKPKLEVEREIERHLNPSMTVTFPSMTRPAIQQDGSFISQGVPLVFYNDEQIPGVKSVQLNTSDKVPSVDDWIDEPIDLSGKTVEEAVEEFGGTIEVDPEGNVAIEIDSEVAALVDDDDFMEARGRGQVETVEIIQEELDEAAAGPTLVEQIVGVDVPEHEEEWAVPDEDLFRFD